MRLRNKNWTKDFIEQNNTKMLNWKLGEMINFSNQFANNNQIYLEIGCGKGNFISQHAINNPKINYIGMEKEETVIGVALKKAISQFSDQNQEMSNLKFLNKFAEKLSDMFLPKSIDRIYLNFSDPWPKAKHYKKRLTHIAFLDIYKEILVDGGEIHLKTDNDGLFAFTIEQFKERSIDWNIIVQTVDLYHDEQLLMGNIPTEYETKFHNLGKNINKIIVRKK